MVLIARAQGGLLEVNVVGEDSTGAEHLGTFDDDAVVAFFDDAGIKIGQVLLVCRFRAVDLRDTDLGRYIRHCRAGTRRS